MTSQYPTASDLQRELEALVERGEACLKEAVGGADDAEIWLTRTSQRGFTFHDQRLVARRDLVRDRVGLRVVKDGRLSSAGACALTPEAFNGALQHARVDPGEPAQLNHFGRPSARRPAPFTFDPDLADTLARADTFQRLAFAMADNVWHEAGRTPGLTSLTGGVVYTLHRRVVVTRRGTVASLHGDLDARIEFNGLYSENFHQNHLPDSFLPLAMLGARAWLNMPRHRVEPDALKLQGRVPVLLHPRLLELLIRRVGEPLLSGAPATGASPFRQGERVAARGITLADDCTLDGLATSRPFDDEGTPTRRVPLIVKGRLSQLLYTHGEATVRGLNPTGNGYRRARGGYGVETAPVQAGLGSLVMDPGQIALNEILAGVDHGLLIYEVSGFDFVDPARSRFQATIASAVTLERGHDSRLLAPGRFRISGHLFSTPDQPSGLMDNLVLSRELYDTGTAILPYCLAYLDLS